MNASQISSSYKVNIVNSDTLIISFAGYAKIFGGIPRFEFVTFMETHFKNISRHFYIDNHVNSYHQGIHKITNNIDETINYLKNEITNYKNVIFLGVSSGGYAAILFGSLLNIKYVVAFIPQTIRRNKNNNIEEKYRDISTFINSNTKYYIYGDLSVTDINHCHHISQCERISHHPNVTLIKKQNIDLRTMRDSGELYMILNPLVNDRA
jgi:predicted esterase YcpF (UPF0227 family)